MEKIRVYIIANSLVDTCASKNIFTAYFLSSCALYAAQYNLQNRQFLEKINKWGDSLKSLTERGELGEKIIYIHICIEYKSNIKEKYSILFPIDKLLLFVDKSNYQIYVLYLIFWRFSLTPPSIELNSAAYKKTYYMLLYISYSCMYVFVFVCVII